MSGAQSNMSAREQSTILHGKTVPTFRRHPTINGAHITLPFHPKVSRPHHKGRYQLPFQHLY